MDSKITRSANTEKLYSQRATALISQAEKELGLIEGITPDELVTWLESKMPSLTYNTFRQYKAALAYYFSTFPDQVYQGASKAIQELQQTERIARTKGKNNSGAARSISEDHLKKLKDAAEQGKSAWAKRAVLLFEATIYGGLRPAEWESLKMAERGLVIKSAKATNGRSSGALRAVPIQEPYEMAIIRQNHERIMAWLESRAEEFETYHMACANAFNALVKKVFNGKRHYRLYTGRHQFSANMKNIYPESDVAKMLGHGSDETAKRHYGKKKSGWKRFKDEGLRLERELKQNQAPSAHKP